MRKLSLVLLIASLLALAALSTAVYAQVGDGFDLTWKVMGGAGGAGPLTGSGFSLDGTLGQTAIGPAAGGDWGVEQGYWYIESVGVSLYLPLLNKEFTP